MYQRTGWNGIRNCLPYISSTSRITKRQNRDVNSSDCFRLWKNAKLKFAAASV